MRFFTAAAIVGVSCAQTAPEQSPSSVDARLSFVSTCPEVSSRCNVPSAPDAPSDAVLRALDCVHQTDLVTVPEGPCRATLVAMVGRYNQVPFARVSPEMLQTMAGALNVPISVQIGDPANNVYVAARTEPMPRVSGQPMFRWTGPPNQPPQRDERRRSDDRSEMGDRRIPLGDRDDEPRALFIDRQRRNLENETHTRYELFRNNETVLSDRRNQTALWDRRRSSWNRGDEDDDEDDYHKFSKGDHKFKKESKKDHKDKPDRRSKDNDKDDRKAKDHHKSKDDDRKMKGQANDERKMKGKSNDERKFPLRGTWQEKRDEVHGKLLRGKAPGKGGDGKPRDRDNSDPNNAQIYINRAKFINKSEGPKPLPKPKRSSSILDTLHLPRRNNTVRLDSNVVLANDESQTGEVPVQTSEVATNFPSFEIAPAPDARAEIASADATAI